MKTILTRDPFWGRLRQFKNDNGRKMNITKDRDSATYFQENPVCTRFFKNQMKDGDNRKYKNCETTQKIFTTHLPIKTNLSEFGFIE